MMIKNFQIAFYQAIELRFSSTLSNMKLNIIIPVYNEEDRIKKTLAELASFLKEPDFARLKLSTRIFVVNDGSEDATFKILQRLSYKQKPAFEIVSYQKNRGKSYAIRYAMQHVPVADYYYVADADLSASWQEFHKLFASLQSFKVDCVIGSRAVKGAKVKTQLFRKIFGRISSIFINLILGLHFKDTQCGYKLYNKACIKKFADTRIDRWGGDFEILYLLTKAKLKIKEMPIKWQHVKQSKVRPLDYIKTLGELIKIRFNF